MKICLKNAAAVGFLMILLPYMILLLANGKDGIHQEGTLPKREYQVLCELMKEDFSWMDDDTLKLMAVLYRTSQMQKETQNDKDFSGADAYKEDYERLYQAVAQTKGQVIQIEGVCRELPYHKISAGQTRSGENLGADYFYVKKTDCPADVVSGAYLSIYYLTAEEFQEVFGPGIVEEDLVLERDDSDYVVRATTGTDSWSGEQLREMLHLPSSCFWLEDTKDGNIRITVKGSGHGFGISLNTANEMMKNGAGISEILDKFYEGASCITIP